MANDPAPVNGLDVINTVYGSGFDINTEGLEDRINAVTDKIEKEYTEGKNIGKKPRILVTGFSSSTIANGFIPVQFSKHTTTPPLSSIAEKDLPRNL